MFSSESRGAGGDLMEEVGVMQAVPQAAGCHGGHYAPQ